jgi:hypothetical protein
LLLTDASHPRSFSEGVAANHPLAVKPWLSVFHRTWSDAENRWTIDAAQMAMPAP